MEQTFFKEYLDIRNEVEQECGALWSEHNKHMNCKDGCASCCQSFKIFPIEFYAIKTALSKTDVKYNKDASEKECVFLINNRCSIYNERPIICRTHGYPLVRLNEEAEAYEVSFCELNFKSFPLEKFHSENVFQEDLVNSKLFMLNKKFIKSFKEQEYDVIELVESKGIVG